MVGAETAAHMPAGGLPPLACGDGNASNYLAWSNLAWLTDSHLHENATVLPPATRTMLAQMRDLAEAMREQSRSAIDRPLAQAPAPAAPGLPPLLPSETPGADTMDFAEEDAASGDDTVSVAPAFPGAAGDPAGTGRLRAPARRLPGLVAACAGALALAAALLGPQPEPAPAPAVDMALAPSPSEPILRQMLTTRLDHAAAEPDRIDPRLMDRTARLPEDFWPLDQLTVEAGLTRSHLTRVDLQRRLSLVSGARLSTDGLFGPETRRALRIWQAANGLQPTGHFDLASIGLLRARTSATPNRSGPNGGTSGEVMLGASRFGTLCWHGNTAQQGASDVLRCEDALPNWVFASLVRVR
ncbi:peptidoglycan-binding protein [Paroceanicella profunda]|uniref:Peptidoglycan-binding protein n=1 Tax=Paroceanicella profunda TaxID=2579971 RepID=A0A5B8FRL3_9RHOB|nr:peptidoglycan-binding domain-containing protein [Paroceanicella profunda]QDL91366.1 peptidoglycan-binding protein [Paroceanicella profunda]